MPAETHQHGVETGPDEEISLLCALMGQGGGDATEEETLTSLSVDGAAMADLWGRLRGEFGEHSLGSADPGDHLIPSMTLAEAANTMARLLATGRDSDAS